MILKNFFSLFFSLPGKYDLHLSQVPLINIHEGDEQTKQAERKKGRKIKKTQPRRRVREEEKSK